MNLADLLRNNARKQLEGYQEDITPPTLSDVNRGLVGGTLGAPVDLVTSALRGTGWDDAPEKPVMGSEWIGDRMQDMNMVSPDRNMVNEIASGFINPGTTAAKIAALGGKLPLIKATFLGAKAKGADLSKMGIAEKLLREGADPATVWKDTGWGRGPDDKMRFEVSDHNAELGVKTNGETILNHLKGMNGGDLPTSFVYEHPELYESYDKLNDSRIKYPLDTPLDPQRLPKDAGAAYDGYANMVALGQKTNEGNAKSNISHELQHAVQGEEGFAGGGSPSEFSTRSNPYPRALTPYTDEYAKLWRTMRNDPDRPKSPLGLPSKESDIDKWIESVDAIKDPIKREQFMDILNRLDDARNDYWGVNNGINNELDNYDKYKRLGGEAEARLTQARLRMTPEERAQQYPWEPEYFKKETGVSPEELILRYDK